MSQNKGAAKTRRGFKEYIRKIVVSLKRGPQTIPLIFLAAAFLIYSLNLSAISNSTANLLAANMGQCEFVTMLFSILAFVVFLRAFPKRQKANKIMIGLLYLFLALVIVADCIYLTRLNAALNGGFFELTESNYFVVVARNVLLIHIIFVALSALLVATLPVYGKLLKKINTSIEVEGNMDMGEIDISGED